MVSNDSMEKRAARRVGVTLRDKYRLERVLGIGGMATVYLGVHRNGNRVAVKMLHPEVSVDEDLRARFVREGYTANSIEHRGVVRVLDDDTAEDGSAFLVMELLEGETLHQRRAMSGGLLPPREVAGLGYQLLDVLVATHDKGIIHRDIKPENLFLTKDGVLKLLDLGIARVRDGSGSAPTRTGRAMGTPAFMPPEQALGRSREIDHRADLWAVGATMFTLIAGRNVHEAETQEEQLVLTATRSAPLLGTIADEVPRAIADVIDRALAFAKEDRWPSAQAMKEALSKAHAAVYGGAISVVVASKRARIEAAPTLAAVPSPAPVASPVPSTSAAPEVTLQPTQRSADDSDGDATRVDPPSSQITQAPDSPLVAPSRRDAPRPPSPARSWVLALSMALALITSFALFGRRTTQPTSSVSIAPAPSASPDACTASVACVAAKGKQHACRAGVCVPLLADGCVLLAEKGDVENDNTIWVGAMYRGSEGVPAAESESVRAVDTARRDLVDIAGGVPPARPGGPKRPLAVVACDDDKDPMRVARHLVDVVKVPAILGFSRSQEAIDLATSLFAERGVVALASNQTTILSSLRGAPGQPRLVWRMTPSSAEFAAAMIAVVQGVFEPDLRASRGVPKDAPIRVALLSLNNTTGLSYGDLVVSHLRFNDKSVAENRGDFRLVRFPENDVDHDRQAAAIDELLAFRPHVVIVTAGKNIVPILEARWPATESFRPRYVEVGTLEGQYTRDATTRWPDLARRILSVDTVTSTPALAKFILRYNELFSPKVTPRDATSAPYDATYLLAFAIAALGDTPITGPALAGAIPRLRPPGDPLDVGPGALFAGFDALARGKNIDLVGTTTSLDFDLETGDAPADLAVFCLKPGAGSAAPEAHESGLVFDARTRKLVGEKKCP